MDSLTQITLGAAMGEVAAGKKLGNRAMIWGAVAGTIPDLDVFANFFMSDIHALAVHRGISHSFLFTFLAPLLFALLARWYYEKDIYEIRAVRIGTGIFFGIFLLFIAVVLGFVVFVISPWLLIGYVPLVSWLCYAMYGRPVIGTSRQIQNPKYWRWYLLFFLAFLTHILLDASTPYGTQLLQPFADTRFEWNGISVADPLYTVPFLICLIVASFRNRAAASRKYWIWAGIFLSSAYLGFGYIQHDRALKIFDERIAEEETHIHQRLVNPTILNTILWHGVAETDEEIIEGYFSFMQDGPPFERLKRFPKNQYMLGECLEEDEIEILQWFTGGYWALDTIPDGEGKVAFNDLRFGSIWPMRGGENYRFIFQFVIDQGSCQVEESDRGGDQDRGNLLRDMWLRIKGNQGVPDSR